jgi:HSP20 family protein
MQLTENREVTNMFNLTRQSSFDELFDFQRAVDRMFDQFWSDLPTRTAANASGSFRVRSTQDGWQVEVPMPGIDPEHVNLEVAGNTLSIRAEVPGEDRNDTVTRYEQSVTLPQFLDLDKLQASHRHGMLQLSIPLKESVKPRRIEIQGAKDERKQLTTA